MLNVRTRDHDEIDLIPGIRGPVRVSRTVTSRVEVGVREGEVMMSRPLEQGDTSGVTMAFTPWPNEFTILKTMIKVSVVVLGVRPNHSIRTKTDNVVSAFIKRVGQGIKAETEVVVAIARVGQVCRLQPEAFASIARAEVQVQPAAAIADRFELADERGPSGVYKDTISLCPT